MSDVQEDAVARAGAGPAVLDVAGLGARYGKIVALQDVSFSVRAGEVVTLLGANGSGKTTLLNTICGFITPSAGRVVLGGKSIGGMPAHAVVHLGVSQVSQGRDLFPGMSVLDNLRLGYVKGRGTEEKGLQKVFDCFPRLRERQNQRAGTLSGGEQQMVAIGRAMMAGPRILLLDEPSAGLAPKFVDEIGRIMMRLRSEGGTMLIVEQNLGLAAQVADRYCILRNGSVVHEGPGEELRADHRAFAQKYYL